ncbi:hypothetical protein PP707_04550 [Acetobacter pasteurianus]|nr:hypothetical protein [Acetobacter pasteurianus]
MGRDLLFNLYVIYIYSLSKLSALSALSPVLPTTKQQTTSSKLQTTNYKSKGSIRLYSSRQQHKCLTSSDLCKSF